MNKVYLWKNDIPLYNEEYKNDDNIGCPSMDCYVSNETKNRPAVLIIPGGGYDHRADHEGATVANEFYGNGFNSFVLNYRVAPYTHPAMLNDAQRAIRFIRYNSKKLNVDPNKILVIGFSAGGSLAGILTENYDKYDYPHTDEIDEMSARPDALALCYSVSSLVDEYAHTRSANYLTGGDEELKKALSLEFNIREDMPPVFMWHTFEDASVNCINSLRLAAAFKQNNVPFELHLFPAGRHGLGLATGIYGTDQWFWLLIKWFKGLHFDI